MVKSSRKKGSSACLVLKVSIFNGCWNGHAASLMTIYCLLNEYHYAGLFLCLLSWFLCLGCFSPLFIFQSMQHISGHAGLSHERECLFKAQQETRINNYNQFTFRLMGKKLKPHHEDIKISPKYKTCKHKNQ